MNAPKVALIVTYPPHVHGGYNESLSFLDDALQILKEVGAEPLIVTSNRDAESDLIRRGLHAVFMRPTPRDRVREVVGASGLDYLLPRHKGDRWTVEHQLRRRGVRFAMFLSPSWWGGALATLPFSTTVWDVSHLDEPSLPEVRQAGEFVRRQRFLSAALEQSEFVVVPDDHVKRVLVDSGYVNERRVIVRPFRPPPAARLTSRPSAHVETLIRTRSPFVFYPAYFWPHKGHIPLLKAISLLGSAAPTLVLTGGDRAHALRQLATDLGVSGQVIVLGTVSDEDASALYRAASAIVMPSLFGPSNLPAVEAWSADTPLVYNKDFGAFACDAAEYAIVDDPSSLAAAISRALTPSRSQELASSGRDLLLERDAASQRANHQIVAFLRKALSA